MKILILLIAIYLLYKFAKKVIILIMILSVILLLAKKSKAQDLTLKACEFITQTK